MALVVAAGFVLVADIFPTFLSSSAIQAGGRPRRRPRPRARRSKLMMASSICSRSWRNSVRIFVTSIGLCPRLKFGHATAGVLLTEQKRDRCNGAHVLFSAPSAVFQGVCSEIRTENQGKGCTPDETAARVRSEAAAFSNDNKRVNPRKLWLGRAEIREVSCTKWKSR
jgi:hypothetical protein